MLQEIYEKYKESLSKSDHKIFGYLLEHEQELPMVTTAELSAQLGISTATISRFWSKIGYKNLNELKKAVYENQETTPFSRMNAALSQWEKVGISPDMIISRMSLHMEKTFRSVTPAMMDQAVDMILKAEHIYLFAPDASGGLGYIMQYRLMRLGIRLIPIPAGSQIYDFMVDRLLRHPVYGSDGGGSAVPGGPGALQLPGGAQRLPLHGGSHAASGHDYYEDQSGSGRRAGAGQRAGTAEGKICRDDPSIGGWFYKKSEISVIYKFNKKYKILIRF